MYWLITKRSTRKLGRSFSSNPFDKFQNTFQHFKSVSFGGISSFRGSINTFGFGNGNGMNGGGHSFTYFLEMCQEAHAREIASRMGLSVNNIEFKTVNNGDKSQIKAFIDAPNATEEQLAELEQSVTEECPMAKFNQMMGNERVQWIKK